MKKSSASASASRAVAPAAQAANFRGTLLLLQNKTKRDPESYYEEFMSQLRHFDALSKVATTTQRLVSSTNVNAAKINKNHNNNNADAADAATGGPSTQQQAQEDSEFTAVLNYLCHVSGCYPKQCAHIPDVLLKALSTTGAKMNPSTRRNFVENLMLLRSKGLVAPEKTLPVMFDLLLVRDKLLRKAVLGHIVSDIRRFNMPKAKGALNSNRVVQNFLFSVVGQDDPTQTRCALLVMIDLYRRGIWANDKCVEVLAQACFSKHSRIVRAALRFFMMQFPKISSLDDPDDDEEMDTKQLTETMTRAVHKYKCKGKTRHRDRVLKHKVKDIKRKLDPELRDKAAFDRQEVDPVRLLRDPQTFAERLLAQLQRTSERFEVRLLYLSVIARVIAEHQVVVLPLYNYLERFLQPTQVHAPTILALTSTCAHPLVPPDALESLVRAIANHFVNDRSQPDAITIGINTIREICKRQPLAMTEDLLKDLVEYRTMRGERGIIMAARSLVQLYRTVDPTMLPAKLRGISYDKETSAASRPVFGASRPLMDIPGMEALYGDEEGDAAEQNLSGFEDQINKKKNGKDDDDDDSDDDDGSDDSSSMIDIPLSDSDGGGDMNDWEFCSNDDDDDEDEELNEKDEEGSNEGQDDDEDDDEEEDDLFDEEDDDEEMMDLDEDSDDDLLSDDDEEEESDDEEEQLLQQKRPRQQQQHSKKDADVWDESDKDDDEEEKHVKKSKINTRAPPVKAHKGEEDSDAKTSLKSSSHKAKSNNKDDEPPRLVPNEVFNKKNNNTASSLAQKPSAATGTGWFEDTTAQDVKSKKQNNKSAASSSMVPSSSASSAFGGATFASTAGSRVSTLRILTDDDFEKLRKIQEGADPNDWRSARGKKKALMEMKKQKNALITPGMGTGQVSESAIESFTNRKRSEDKAEKIAQAQELRKQRSPFELRKKRKSKLSSTHTEKSKKGKLFQMTKRSARVGAKLKLSAEDRRDKAKEMKKRNIKFRINRGWKA